MSVKEVGRLKGLIPATFTPLDPDGELNLKLIPDYVSHLATNGIEYIFINGTTGEGPSLTVEERKQSAEAWLRSSRGGLKGVMVHVGAGNSVRRKKNEIEAFCCFFLLSLSLSCLFFFQSARLATWLGMPKLMVPLRSQRHLRPISSLPLSRICWPIAR